MIEIDKIEAIFFKVLDDLKHYLRDLTLVGGWAPFVYARYLWNNIPARPIATVAIDFGFGETTIKSYSKTIFQTLSSLDYTERHPRMDRIYPVVLYKEGKVPVDFITFPEIADDTIEKFIGRQININKIDDFDFLIKNRIPIDIKVTKRKPAYKIYCPKPSAFIYHKGATFIEREDQQKQTKDLYYMYFILRYAPDLDSIFKEIIQFKKDLQLENIAKNLNRFFERKSSYGCLMVEKENGPDAYIDDLRQDVFERFKKLRELL